MVYGLFSCHNEQTLSGERINLFGNQGRTNSYKTFGAFLINTSENEKINAIDSSGSMVAPLAVSSYQTVFATVEGTIHQFSSARVEWSAKLDSTAFVIAGMCADNNHNIYAVASDGCIYSISSEGKRRFKTVISSDETASFKDLLALSDGIIISQTKGLISKLSFEGKILWQFKSTLSPVNTASADWQNNIYVSLTFDDYSGNDSLLCLSTTGKLNWAIGFTSTRILTSPIVGNNNIILGVVQSENKPLILSIDFHGNLLWNNELRATPRGISITAEGSIITVSYNSGIGISQSVIEQFSPKGKSDWHIKFDSRMVSPALIGNDNIAIIGVKSSAIGVYLLHRNGILDTFFSIETAPSLLLKPVVAPNGNIIFAGSHKGYITRVGVKKGLLPI